MTAMGNTDVILLNAEQERTLPCCSVHNHYDHHDHDHHGHDHDHGHHHHHHEDEEGDLSSLRALLLDPLLSSPDDRAPSLLRVLT